MELEYPSETVAAPEAPTTSDLGRETEDYLAGAAARLRAIEEAIAALEAGTYGRCEVCNAPVEAARLAARASQRRCAEHEDTATATPRLF